MSILYLALCYVEHTHTENIPKGFINSTVIKTPPNKQSNKKDTPEKSRSENSRTTQNSHRALSERSEEAPQR